MLLSVVSPTISTQDFDSPLRHETSGRFGSQSSTVTLAFCSASVVASTRVVVLFPAPPLGLATAMTGMASPLWPAKAAVGQQKRWCSFKGHVGGAVPGVRI